MKKTLSILLCLSLILALSACDTQHSPTTAPTTAPTTVPTTAPTTAPTTVPTEPSLPEATEPTDPTVPGVTEPVVYNLPMSAIALTQQAEASRDDDDSTYFIYTYPNVRLYLNNEAVSESVTLDLLNRIDATRTQADAIRNEALDLGVGANPFSFTVTYIPQRIDNGILSLSCMTTSYVGGAHPGSTSTGITYDLLTGSVLGLGDILKEDCTADVIARLVIDALAAVSDDNYLYDDYSVTVEERFSGDFRTDECWYLSSEGLCFVFSPYELAPYSSGVITAVIPYENLIGVLEDACFPVEKITAEGGLFSCAYEDGNTSQYNRFAEVVLYPTGSATLFYTDGLLYDITIETGHLNTEGSVFTPESVVFAASSLVPADAIVLQAQPDTYVRITYISGGKTLTLIQKLFSQ